MGRSVVPFRDYRNPALTQPLVFTMQNGRLIDVGTLKNSAFLKNLIYRSGFGSVLHHQHFHRSPIKAGNLKRI